MKLDGGVTYCARPGFVARLSTGELSDTELHIDEGCIDTALRPRKEENAVEERC